MWLAKTQDRSLGAPLVEAARTARAGQPAILKAIDELKQKPAGLAQVATALLDSPDTNVRYAALGTMMQTDIHALALETRTPDEF